MQKYSNFVGFPILLNGDKLNTIQPLWTLPKEAVSEEQHKGRWTRMAARHGSYAWLTGACLAVRVAPSVRVLPVHLGRYVRPP